MPAATHGLAPIPVFLNPAAGSADAVRRALDGDAAFALHESEEPSRLSDLLREAVERGARRVAVAGGDGTIAAAAGALAGSGTELAVIPAGTLNHFARDHRIPTDAAEATRLAREGTAQPVDIAWANDRPVLNTSSIGSYVTFVRVRERIEEAGIPYRLASLLAFARVLVSLRRLVVAVEVEGERRIYRTPLVFVGVGERELAAPTLGGRLEDGRAGLHVIVVQGRTRTGLLLLGVAMAARGLRAAPRGASHGVDVFLTDHFSVETGRPAVRVAVDGELALAEARVEYRHAPDALRVVLPPPAADEGAAGAART